MAPLRILIHTTRVHQAEEAEVGLRGHQHTAEEVVVAAGPLDTVDPAMEARSMVAQATATNPSYMTLNRAAIVEVEGRPDERDLVLLGPLQGTIMEITAVTGKVKASPII